MKMKTLEAIKWIKNLDNMENKEDMLIKTQTSIKKYFFDLPDERTKGFMPEFFNDCEFLKSGRELNLKETKITDMKPRLKDR